MGCHRLSERMHKKLGQDREAAKGIAVGLAVGDGVSLAVGVTVGDGGGVAVKVYVGDGALVEVGEGVEPGTGNSRESRRS